MTVIIEPLITVPNFIIPRERSYSSHLSELLRDFMREIVNGSVEQNDMGGREDPYPYAIRSCADEDEVMRALRVYPPDGTTQVTAIDPGVSPSTVLDIEWDDPEPVDINTMTQYLEAAGAVGICQRLVSEDPRRHGLFWVTKSSVDEQYIAPPPDMKGLESPYPRSVPQCTGGMQVKRVILVEDPENEGSFASTAVDPNVDPYAKYGVPWWDPLSGQVSQVEEVVRDSGAVGLCQGYVSTEPIRYGLFWVMQADPLAVFDNQSVASDAASQQRINEELLATLPKEIRECMPGVEDSMQNYYMMEAFNQRLYELEMEKISSYTMAEASSMALRVVYDNGLIDTNDDQLEILTRVLAQALKHDVPKEELEHIAHELSYQFIDPPRFIYGLITIISLRIGEILHQKNIVNGGIVEDYESYARSIEEAILDGRIDLRVLSAAETIRQPESYAAYNSMFNDISYPALNKYTSLATMIEPVLHECYHAYQDKQDKPMTTGGSEWQAYTMQTRAIMLFMGPHVITKDPALHDLSDRLREFYGEALIKKLACMGGPESVLIVNQDLIVEQMESNNLWRIALAQELTGSEDVSADLLFSNRYSIFNYFMVNQHIFTSSVFRAHQDSKALIELSPDKKDAELNKIIFMAGENKEFLLQTEPMTFEQGVAALAFANYANYAGCLLFFVDREKYMELMEMNADREVIDFLAGALLFAPRYFDGI